MWDLQRVVIMVPKSDFFIKTFPWIAHTCHLFWCGGWNERRELRSDSLRNSLVCKLLSSRFKLCCFFPKRLRMHVFHSTPKQDQHWHLVSLRLDWVTPFPKLYKLFIWCVVHCFFTPWWRPLSLKPVGVLLLCGFLINNFQFFLLHLEVLQIKTRFPQWTRYLSLFCLCYNLQSD